MSNDFYNLTTPIPEREIARANRVNSEFQAVAAGFDKLLSDSAATGRTTMWATASGGPNNYVLTLPKPPTGYAGGMQIAFRATGANTGGVSVNVNGLGAKAVVNNASGAALAAGELAGASGTVIVIVYDGLAAFRLISAGAPIDSTPGEETKLYDLVDDGTTDQSDEFEALIIQAVSESWPSLDLVGQADGSSEILIDRRIVLDAMPPSMTVSRIVLKFNAANGAGLYICGQEVELPETGKAKLWTDVDVSGGAVTAFDISVSANPAIVDLLVAGAIVIIRGQNGADGDVLDGHKHEDTVVSCVQVSGTRYTLTLTDGLPDTIDGSVWKTEWPDSEHTADPDETLISVLAMAPSTANMTDSRTMTIAAGKAAALGLATGSWVEVIDDATGSDTHGTSTELLNRQTVRIAAVEAGTPDTITFDEPVRGTFTTANRARLVLLTTCPEFKFQGPGPAFPVRVIGTPPAAPASRRHLIEVKYAISPEITGCFYEYVAADGSTRGTPIRDSNCYEPWVHHNGVVNPWPDFAGAFTGGDYYCAWSKGSTRPLYEHNDFVGGRHSLVIANAKGGTVRFNRLGYSGFQCLDFHGENEIAVEAYGNVIVRGPAWADRERHVAIQAGNQTHTFGTSGALIRDNDIVGFDAAADVGVLIVSGCRDIIVDQHFVHPVGEAVRIDADNRAPDVMIERVTIAGSAPAATVGVAIDGRMQIWESGGEVSASASRPVTIWDSTSTRAYTTTDTGTLGTTNPEATSGTEVSGEITLTYVGLVAAQTIPIDGVKILADLSRAGAEVSVYRAANVTYGVDTGSYLQRGDVFPEPGLVESVAGAFVLDWETDFDGPRLVKLVRAAGDVSESLLVTLPETPSGDWATVLVTEPMTFVAPNRTFALAASWEDILGVGTFTITESGVTTATLGLAAGDVVSGGPFDSPTTIATIESDSVFTTTDPCGETGSGTINIVAPAYSIDGSRLLGSPAMGPSGVLMQFTVMAASTPTTRGEIKTPERPAGTSVAIVKTAAQWVSENTILGIGQRGYESDTRKSKTGTTGTTAWNDIENYDKAEGDHDAVTLSSVRSATISSSRELVSSDATFGLDDQEVWQGRFRFVDASGGAIVLSLADSLSVGDEIALLVTDASNSVTIARPTVAVAGTGTTNGTAVVAMADTSPARVGDAVAGTTVTSSQTVLSIITDTSITLSAVADGTATDDDLTFTGKRGVFNGSEADITLREGWTAIKVTGSVIGADAELIGATNEGMAAVNIVTESADFAVSAIHLGKRVRMTKGSGTQTVTVPKPSVINAGPGVMVVLKATLAGATAFTLAGTGGPTFDDIAANTLGITPGGEAVLTAADDDTWDLAGAMIPT